MSIFMVATTVRVLDSEDYEYERAEFWVTTGSIVTCVYASGFQTLETLGGSRRSLLRPPRPTSL